MELKSLHVRAYGSTEEKEAWTEMAGFCSLDCMRLSHFSHSERSELLFLGIYQRQPFTKIKHETVAGTE